MTKKFNNLFLILLCSFILITLYGCGLLGGTDKLTAISIEADNIVEVEGLLILSINVTPSDQSKLVTWSSSNDEIATVDEAGVLHAHSEGEVIITAVSKVDSSISDQHTVTVVGAVPTSVIIKGSNSVSIGEVIVLTANVNPSNACQLVTWSSSDESIATVSNEGNVFGVSSGTVVITATSIQDRSISKIFNLEVLEGLSPTISISGPSSVIVGSTISLSATLTPPSLSETFVWTSSNEDIATVDNLGNVLGESVGLVNITCSLVSDSNIKSVFELSVTEDIATELTITGKSYVEIGRNVKMAVNFNGTGSGTVKWESLNNSILKIYDGTVIGVVKGTTQIKASLIENPSVSDTFEIEVIEYEIVTSSPDSQDLLFVNNIINEMTLEEKIGQLFIVGVGDNSGVLKTGFTETIQEYKFGNFIYMGNNVNSTSQVVKLSINIQDLVASQIGIPAFISIDQEGGMVQRMTVGATHFLGNMAVAATNNPENAYQLGAAMGLELKNYGINLNFAPVLDVNNNPANPIINVRSYSDDAAKVAVFGQKMFEGLSSSNVMGCAKHFPGHGDTSVDSHTDLPIIYHNIDRLNEIELLPFKNAISNGIDAIMTTHIIFSEVDNENPATLSNAVLTGILRNQLGFDGLIVTDGLEMGAITNNYFSYGEVGVLAVQAGVDLLTFTDYSGNVLDAYDGILNAVQTNVIEESRIDESVRRILLKKLKYNLFEENKPSLENMNTTFPTHIALNENLARSSFTKVKGNFSGLDSNKSTLIISTLSPRYAMDSLAYTVSEDLKNNGFSNCTYKTINESMKASAVDSLVNFAKNYEQVVIATYNVTTSVAGLVSRLYNNNNNLVAIAMRNPYDINSYSTVKNYFCAYDYTPVVVAAIADYLKGEYIARGVIPVNLSN
ncbi:MAG: glycoside hydrolase family 3 N-terminal domain-containing protein [Bacilli bacterium]|jgi:beta-N-acetylhexosaminidase